MSLIVQKFGGSSVANAERVMNVARIVTDTYKAGNEVVVVVSAQGDTTDDLIAKAQEINPKAKNREIDQLLAAGEQISISLLAMAIESLGFPVISLLGWQAGFNTNSVYGSARIKNIKPNRLQAELARHNIVVVAGFRVLTDMMTLPLSAEAVRIHPLLPLRLHFMQINVKSLPMLRVFTQQTQERLKMPVNSRKSLMMRCLNLQLWVHRCSTTVR